MFQFLYFCYFTTSLCILGNSYLGLFIIQRIFLFSLLYILLDTKKKNQFLLPFIEKTRIVNILNLLIKFYTFFIDKPHIWVSFYLVRWFFCVREHTSDVEISVIVSVP